MKQGEVRIIAGKWRSRRLKVANIPDLRPTPDRVRETLFNWLSPYIVGARCLDLFAGSGVLGFEALSRGAAYVEMVDESPEVITLLNKEWHEFGATNGRIYQAIVPKELSIPPEPFDIIFLDPPYKATLLLTTCQYLEENNFLSASAYIYLEADRHIEDNELPLNWRSMKSRQAGQVFYHLVHREKV